MSLQNAISQIEAALTALSLTKSPDLARIDLADMSRAERDAVYAVTLSGGPDPLEEISTTPTVFAADLELRIATQIANDRGAAEITAMGRMRQAIVALVASVPPGADVLHLWVRGDSTLEEAASHLLLGRCPLTLLYQEP